ncbi:MAG: GNAT family N-acetyltransferase [Saprospiraceae bacterium]|nr:GNAT family N-acetyltransferase [Saprospiraceae bacterium]
MTGPIIETDRLILRQFIESDFEAVYEFGSNPEIQKYTGEAVLQSPDQAKELIRNVWLKDYRMYGYGRWATIVKSENKLIGFAGLKYLPELDETDIGYRFLPNFWGKGIATETSREIIKYGFEQLNLDRIIGIAMPENIASWKVMEKIGFSFYKVDEYDGDGGAYNWYKIEKAQYLEKRLANRS